MMFFQCLGGLLSPIYRRREGAKWGVITYTLAIFSFVTVYTAMNLNIESISYIDNRDFPGAEGMPPGPLGYRSFIYADPISVTPNVMFFLNNWLADGFLVSSLFDIAFLYQVSNQRLPQLHRCYIIYARNIWVIAFPLLVYLASVGTYGFPQPGSDALG